MKLLRCFAVLLALLLLCGCQQNQSDLKDSVSNDLELYATNESLSAKVVELKGRIEVADEMNKELRDQIKILEENTKTIEDEVVKDEEISGDMVYENIVSNYSEGMIYFMPIISEIPDNVYNGITLIGYSAYFDDDTLPLIDYSNRDNPAIAIDVIGTLYNFRVVDAIWSDDFKEYKITNEICHFDELRNKRIVFNSIFAEGRPNETIIWENEMGESKHYSITANGAGFSGKILICDEYMNWNE